MSAAPPDSSAVSVLLIDDDQAFCQNLLDYLTAERGLDVSVAHSAAAGLALAAQRSPQLVLLDQRLPDAEGTDVCRQLLEHCEDAKVVLMTAYPTFRHAVGALEAGACDYLTKPFDPGELDFAIDRALRTQELERLKKLQDHLQRQQAVHAQIVGELSQVRGMLARAKARAAALVVGPPGSGKSLIAECLHYTSERADGPFVAFGCGAHPAERAELELFGVARGADAEAGASAPGVFELAQGGTLLLEDVDQLPLPLQAKLARALSERSVRRVGADRPRGVDAKLVATTRQDLGAASAQGTFDSDLYLHLGSAVIELPPLRARPQDIPALCEHLLAQLSPSRRVSVPPRDQERMQAYAWPGNVRELRNVLERALLLASREAVLHPAEYLPATGSSWLERPGNVGEQSGETAERWAAERLRFDTSIPTLAQIEHAWIDVVLVHLEGNLTQTARSLGISRSTLKRKLRQSSSTSLKTLRRRAGADVGDTDDEE